MKMLLALIITIIALMILGAITERFTTAKGGKRGTTKGQVI